LPDKSSKGAPALLRETRSGRRWPWPRSGRGDRRGKRRLSWTSGDGWGGQPSKGESHNTRRTSRGRTRARPPCRRDIVRDIWGDGARPPSPTFIMGPAALRAARRRPPGQTRRVSSTKWCVAISAGYGRDIFGVGPKTSAAGGTVFDASMRATRSVKRALLRGGARKRDLHSSFRGVGHGQQDHPVSARGPARRHRGVSVLGRRRVIVRRRTRRRARREKTARFQVGGPVHWRRWLIECLPRGYYARDVPLCDRPFRGDLGGRGLSCRHNELRVSGERRHCGSGGLWTGRAAAGGQA